MARESHGKCVFLTVCTKKLLGPAMQTLFQVTSVLIKRVRCWRETSIGRIYIFLQKQEYKIACLVCVKNRLSKLANMSCMSYINQRIYAHAVGPYSPGVKFRGETVRYWISIEDGFSRCLVTGQIKDLSAKTVQKRSGNYG